jgi:hypothetical protein
VSDTLTSLTERVRCLLKDSASLTWNDAEIGECIHQALDDVNQSSGQAWSLAGLDSAAETVLPAGLASLLARGAAAYALMMLAASRADLFNFQPGVCQTLAAAGQALLKQFQIGLAFLSQIRASELQSSANAPFSTAVDELPAGWRLDNEMS